MSETTATVQEKRTTASTDHRGDARFNAVDRAIKRVERRPDGMIEVLHTAQEAFGYLTPALLVYIASQLHVPLSKVYGVATFYHFFSFTPRGEHTCTVCLGTACFVKGAADILATLQAEFDLKPGQTTEDGQLSLSVARCLGCCGLAPVMVVDGQVVSKNTPPTAVQQIEMLLSGQPAQSESNG